MRQIFRIARQVAPTVIFFDQLDSITPVRGAHDGSMGIPSEVAPAVVFLASEEARFITGQTLSVNGGNSILKDAFSDMGRLVGGLYTEKVK